MGTAAPGEDTGQEHAQDAQEAQEARDYVRRMRSLPVDQILGEVLFGLLNAAQVKLGRRDARLLIDVGAVAHEHQRLSVFENADVHDVTRHRHRTPAAHASQLRDPWLRFAVERDPRGVLSGRDDERLV